MVKQNKLIEPEATGMLKSKKRGYILQAWLVLTLALCFGASLAGVQLTLGPTIEENKINETRQKVPELVLGTEKAQKIEEQGQALFIEPHTISVEKPGKKISYSVYEARLNENLVGWVIKTVGQGYADKIELLLGLDPQAKTITGLFILEQKETPGLGNKIITEAWRKQFINKDTGRQLIVVKKGSKALNEIDAITGATISSRAVTGLVNTAIGDLKGSLVAKVSQNQSTKDE